MRYYFPISPYNQQRQFEKPAWVYPVHLAMYATWLKARGHQVIWEEGKPIMTFDRVLSEEEQDAYLKNPWQDYKVIASDDDIPIPFDMLPIPDRVFTDAKNKRWQRYGNYKFHPATHMMVSNLCWWGKCTFCHDTKQCKAGAKRYVRKLETVMHEMETLVAEGYREVFDDSGSWPYGFWSDEFCHSMIRSGMNKKIKIGCNLKPYYFLKYDLFAKAGFRMILCGIESANNATLEKLNKGIEIEEVFIALQRMVAAGLEPHGAFMTGYPWEDENDEKKTIAFCHEMLKKGYLKTAQVSVYSPESRTVPSDDSPGHKYLPRFFDIYYSPRFWITKMRDLKKWEDFTYAYKGIKLILEEKWRKRS